MYHFVGRETKGSHNPRVYRVAFGGTVTPRVSADSLLVHDEATLPRTLSYEASA